MKPAARTLCIDVLPVGLLAASLVIKLVAAGRFDRWQVESAATSATAAVVCLLYAPIFLAARPVRFVLAIILNAVFTTLLIADQVHFRFFGDLVAVSQLTYAWMLPSISASIASRLTAAHLYFYTDVVAAAILLVAYRKVYVGPPEISRRARGLISAGAALSGIVLAAPSADLVRRDPDHIFEWRSSRTQYAAAVGVLPYHVFDVATHAAAVWRRTLVTDAERARVRAVLAERHSAERSGVFGISRGKNLIVVQAESLQAFPLGLRLNGQSVAPNLDALAQESLRFENFFDQTWLGATSDSLFMAFQSLYPLGPGEGAVATRYLTNQYRGLPAIVSEHGYATVAAMGAPGKYWNIADMLRRLGFGQLYLDEAFPDVERFGQGVSDDAFFRLTVPLLARQREPFMGFLISASNHHPYELPEHHRRLPLGALQRTLLGHYLDSVHFFDRAFGEFVAQLRDTGLMDRSVVVVYGDHEGWLDDSPELARLLRFDPSNLYEYWKARKKLPLLIRLPRGERAGTIRIPGGHADLAPTMLALLGIPDQHVMLGSDLTREPDPLVVFRDGSFVTRSHYFLNAGSLGPFRGCYDLTSDRRGDCRQLQASQQRALGRLHASDAIIRGNLVPALSSEGLRGSDASR